MLILIQNVLQTVKTILTKVVIVVVLGIMIATAVVIATVSNSSEGDGVLLSPMRDDITYGPSPWDRSHGNILSANNSLNPESFLKEFNYGRVSTMADGTTLREFTLVAQDVVLEVAPGVYFNAWTYNGTIPGPTIRATEGDKVRVTFLNQGSHPHTIHFHGIHAGDMDGVLEWVYPGGRFVYEFTAEPFGVFLYHCHVSPIEEHINRGLYGAYIVDPKTPRSPATEMVMLLNGYDTDFDTENNFYTVNGVAFYYMHHPIEIKTGEPVRIYLINMLEFDTINNFHLHGNVFKYYRTGTILANYELTDMVTMSQAERGVLEFTYKYPGMYMFHAHKIEFADKGWNGFFKVVEGETTNGGVT